MKDNVLRIHNRHQFEIRFAYPSDVFTSLFSRPLFQVELYFFFPKNLGLNRYHYEKKDFYSDTLSYIQVEPMPYSLRNLASKDGAPFERLSVSIDHWRTKPSQLTFQQVEHQLKMTCYAMKRALKNHKKTFLKHKTLSKRLGLIQDYCRHIKVIEKKFRKNIDFLSTSLPSSGKNEAFSDLKGEPFAQNILPHVDEFLSFLLEEHSYFFLEKIKKLSFSNKEKVQNRLLSLVKHEVAHRKKKDYPSASFGERDTEHWLFRKAVLRKFIDSVVFIKTHTEREGVVLEQIFLGGIAGIAMVFATSVAFFSQHHYGTFTLPFFIALVISYMFKDRIKDVLKNYLHSKLSHQLYDHKSDIFYDSKQKIGWCKESFHFIKEAQLSSDVIRLRNRNTLTDIENNIGNNGSGEKIILYRKKIKLFSRMFKKMYPKTPIRAVNDRMRFNVMTFLKKMSHSKKTLFLCHERGYKKIYGERVYHLNLIVCYSMKHREWKQRYRLILNWKGLKRIEKVC